MPHAHIYYASLVVNLIETSNIHEYLLHNILTEKDSVSQFSLLQKTKVYSIHRILSQTSIA